MRQLQLERVFVSTSPSESDNWRDEIEAKARVRCQAWLCKTCEMQRGEIKEILKVETSADGVESLTTTGDVCQMGSRNDMSQGGMNPADSFSEVVRLLVNGCVNRDAPSNLKSWRNGRELRESVASPTTSGWPDSRSLPVWESFPWQPR